MKHFINRTAIRRLLTASTAILLSGNAYAVKPVPVYTMTVFEDARFGSEVQAGNYADAIEKLTPVTERRKNDFAAATNLCVAFTKSGDLENAVDVCNRAVAVARKGARRTSTLSAGVFAFATSRTRLALALSNRGVLRAALGDAELARKDFEEAIKLRATLSAPKINLARLDRAA